MAIAAPRQARFATAPASRARCVKVAAVNRPNMPSTLVATAAAALLLCSPVVAAPIITNPVMSELASGNTMIKTDDNIESQKSANPNKTPGQLPPGPANKDRPAAYAKGEGQTNCPCPPGALKQCPCN